MVKQAVVVMTFLLLTVSTAMAHCGTCPMSKGSKSGDGTESSYCEKCPYCQAGKSGDWAEKKLQVLTERLSLTPEQVEQVKPILAEKMEKKASIMEEKKADMEAVHEDYSTKLKALLTPEQLKQYESWKTDMKKGSMKGSHHEHKGSKKGS